jgi:hypothetical protein
VAGATAIRNCVPGELAGQSVQAWLITGAAAAELRDDVRDNRGRRIRVQGSLHGDDRATAAIDRCRDLGGKLGIEGHREFATVLVDPVADGSDATECNELDLEDMYAHAVRVVETGTLAH